MEMGKQKEMGNFTVLVAKARGFKQRYWKEISGTAQGESWGGGRGGAIQLQAVGCLEGSKKRKLCSNQGVASSETLC